MSAEQIWPLGPHVCPMVRMGIVPTSQLTFSRNPSHCWSQLSCKAGCNVSGHWNIMIDGGNLLSLGPAFDSLIHSPYLYHPFPLQIPKDTLFSDSRSVSCWSLNKQHGWRVLKTLGLNHNTLLCVFLFSFPLCSRILDRGADSHAPLLGAVLWQPIILSHCF